MNKLVFYYALIITAELMCFKNIQIEATYLSNPHVNSRSLPPTVEHKMSSLFKLYHLLYSNTISADELIEILKNMKKSMELKNEEYTQHWLMREG